MTDCAWYVYNDNPLTMSVTELTQRPQYRYIYDGADDRIFRILDVKFPADVDLKSLSVGQYKDVKFTMFDQTKVPDVEAGPPLEVIKQRLSQALEQAAAAVKASEAKEKALADMTFKVGDPKASTAVFDLQELRSKVSRLCAIHSDAEARVKYAKHFTEPRRCLVQIAYNVVSCPGEGSTCKIRYEFRVLSSLCLIGMYETSGLTAHTRALPIQDYTP